ncbi:hypothetical protein [Phaeovulum sp.]|uniref:hypothetical protein n=1 Tax=Phaeovulum sp. TaxID=2934796 RepID=UPI0035629B08
MTLGMRQYSSHAVTGLRAPALGSPAGAGQPVLALKARAFSPEREKIKGTHRRLPNDEEVLIRIHPGPVAADMRRNPSK